MFFNNRGSGIASMQISPVPEFIGPFSQKQAQNARFQSLKTSVLGLFSQKRVYKFGHWTVNSYEMNSAAPVQ
jgi:hypothetical protein